MKFVITLAAALTLLVACTPAANSDVAGSRETVKTLYIGPERVPCTGVAEQECLQVKNAPAEDWSLLYTGIQGFEYEAGNFYVLRVRETEVANPPADGSSLALSLVEVLEQDARNKPD